MTQQQQDSQQYRRTSVGESLLEGLDALLVTRWENLRYLSGFTGSNGALLLRREGDATLATDGRYLLQAAAEAPNVEVVESRLLGPTLIERAAASGHTRIGIEAAHVTLTQLRAMRSAAGESVTLVETEGLIESLRSVKDEAELAALRRACEITDAAFKSMVLTGLTTGVTERELADRLYAAMRAEGAEGAAFDPIVAFGENSAVPHHQPTDRVLKPGDLVKTDFGARYAGYHADMTRTVVCGRAADWQREVHAQVVEIQGAGKLAAVPGAAPSELDAAARAAIEATGHRVMHGLGHGVGLQIHEDPFVTPGSKAGPLVPGNVITIEPGIYIEGQGGVRIEDTIAVSDYGPESLTASPRELIEI